MQHLQKLVFISAIKHNSKDDYNHNQLKRLLEKSFQYTEIVGSYEGMKEKSYMVVINNLSDLEYMKLLGEEFCQDSILYRDHEGNSNLIFMDGRESINLGKMVQVSEKEALSSIAYTYVPNLNSYWIAK